MRVKIILWFVISACVMSFISTTVSNTLSFSLYGIVPFKDYLFSIAPIYAFLAYLSLFSWYLLLIEYSSTSQHYYREGKRQTCKMQEHKISRRNECWDGLKNCSFGYQLGRSWSVWSSKASVSSAWVTFSENSSGVVKTAEDTLCSLTFKNSLNLIQVINI